MTSPAEIEKKLNLIGFENYQPIEHSKIFHNLISLDSIQKKHQILKYLMKKKYKKNKNINQKSFYFEDFLETNKKSKSF